MIDTEKLSLKEATFRAESIAKADCMCKLQDPMQTILDGTYMEQDNYYLFFPKKELVTLQPPTVDDIKESQNSSGIHFGFFRDLTIFCILLDRRNGNYEFIADFRDFEEDRREKFIHYFFSKK